MPEKWPTYSPDEALELVQAAQDYWNPRSTRMYDEQVLFDLTQPDPAKPGRVKVIDNTPYNVVSLGAAIMARNTPHFSVRTPIDHEALRKRADLLEQVVLGALRELNRLQRNRGEAAFVPLLAHSLLLRGWYAVRVLMPKPKKKDNPFKFIRILDPINVFQGPYTSEGPIWVAHSYPLAFGSAQAAYPEWSPSEERKPYETVIVHDFYDGVNETVLIDDAPIRTLKHGFSGVPIITGPATPYLFKGSSINEDTTYPGRQGRSLLYGIVDLQNYYNELLSNVGTLIKKYALPTIVVRTRDGQTREMSLGSGDVNALQLTDVVEVIQMPGTPPDLIVVLNAVFGAIQRATFSQIMYGDAPAGTPATGMAILGQHTRAVLEPYARVMEDVLEELVWRMLWFIENNKIQLAGLQGESSLGQSFVLDNFDYTAIQGDYVVRASIDPSLPQDLMQMYQVAAMATNPANPLVSVEFAREELIKVQNPSRERDRIDKEMGRRLPQVQLAMAYQGLLDEGQDAAAAFLGQAAQALGLSFGGAPGVASQPAPQVAPAAITPNVRPANQQRQP